MSTKQAYQELFKNQKQRNIFIIFAAIGLVAVVAAGINIYNQKEKQKQATAQVSVDLSSTPVTDDAPGQSTNPIYNESVKDVNQAVGEKSLEEGKSFEPKLTNSDLQGGSIIDNLQNQPEPVVNNPAPVQTPTPVVQEKIEQQVSFTPVVVNPEIVKVSTDNSPKYNSSLLNLLSQEFRNKGSDIEKDYTRQQNNNTSQTINSVNQQNSNQSSSNEAVVLEKTGTVLTAVLDTSINTDEPGPVLATIVGGKFDKSKLICSMTANNQTTLITCNKMNSPKLSKTIAINSVAVDVNTTRTGLATSVDNHYFERYVVGLGAAFLKGYAEAIGRQNSTTVVNPDGSIVTSQGQISSKDITNSALGEVGKTLAQDISSRNTNLKPTVRVNSGTAIGLVLLDDITIQ